MEVYKPNEPYDINTLPASSNTNRLDPYLKAMVLCSITEQMMISNNSTIVYSNDGSGMSGVGVMWFNLSQLMESNRLYQLCVQWCIGKF